MYNCRKRGRPSYLRVFYHYASMSQVGIQGISLFAVDMVIKNLGLAVELDEDECIVLSQAGPMSRLPGQTMSATKAYEKIAKPLRRMGSRQWVAFDNAWLCLSTGDRPGIEDVVLKLPSTVEGHFATERFLLHLKRMIFNRTLGSMHILRYSSELPPSQPRALSLPSRTDKRLVRRHC